MLQRLRTRHLSLWPFLLATTLGLGGFAYYCRNSTFVSSLLLNLTGVAAGLLALTLVYDGHQRRRRLLLWRTVRQAAVNALASRVCYMINGVHWRICEPGYVSWGNFVKECDTLPAERALASLTEKVTAVQANVALNHGRFDAREIPAPNHAHSDGKYLLQVIEEVNTPEALASLRDLTVPLYLIGDDVMPLITAVERYVNFSWHTWQSGCAARAGEGADVEFMHRYPILLDHLLAIFKSCSEDLAKAPPGVSSAA